MLAPALLTWIRFVRARMASGALSPAIEAGLIGCGLIAIGILVFNQENVGENRIPVLVYLPLPFLLWAAVRSRPSGVNTCLQIVASLAISGAVQGRGLRSPSALRPTTCLRSSCCWSRYPSR
jgi:two-component system sensor kinase FixL